MMEELFIGGDPRFLSNGGQGSFLIDYNRAPVKISGSTLTSEQILTSENKCPETVVSAHQALHSGKSSYHDRPRLNTFLKPKMFPTVGIELEMEERNDTNAMRRMLVSNWFHFENDSSLVIDGHCGYELITEPLPPNIYRNIRLWIGLQNILTPWMESYGYPQTGLHIHVGTEQFRDVTSGILQYVSGQDRMWFAKMVVVYLYYLLDKTYIDQIMLRANEHYCSCPRPGLTDAFMSKRFENANDLITEIFFSGLPSIFGINRWSDAFERSFNSSSHQIFTIGNDTFAQIRTPYNDHCSEVNTSHPYTVEFRRGKGTLNGMSIHRMVELATLIVRYAYKIMNKPESAVTKKDLYQFIIDNSASKALVELTKDYIK